MTELTTSRSEKHCHSPFSDQYTAKGLDVGLQNFLAKLTNRIDLACAEALLTKSCIEILAGCALHLFAALTEQATAL